MPWGKLKLAAVPVASVEPAVPEPANVVTTAFVLSRFRGVPWIEPPSDGAILRILLLEVSTTNRFVPSVIMPSG